MSDDDIPTTTLGKSFTYGSSTSMKSEEATPEQRLFAIAERFRMPLQRLPGDTPRMLADRLSLALEHQIALMLLDLEEIAALDLDNDEETLS